MTSANLPDFTMITERESIRQTRVAYRAARRQRRHLFLRRIRRSV